MPAPDSSRRVSTWLSAGAATQLAAKNTTTPKRSATNSGLRGLNVGTGCGAGAMKGPMKGATIGHAKQRIRTGRYVGITEPGIIAAESPNPIVNSLVIMPDMEKRLEAFVRLGTASSCSRAASARRRKFSTCWVSCCIRTTKGSHSR